MIKQKTLYSPHLLSANDLFCNFDLDKVKGKGNIKRTYKCADKKKLTKKIFFRFLCLLFDDLILGNKIFVFPYKFYTCLRMRVIPRNVLANARKKGMLTNVDPLISNFQSYEPVITYKPYGALRWFNSPVVVSKNYKASIAEKVNTGFKYC